MTITTRITVNPDGTIQSATLIPAGTYTASVEPVGERPARQMPTLPFDVDALPKLDLGPWPEGLSLRREDLYDDEDR